MLFAGIATAFGAFLFVYGLILLIRPDAVRRPTSWLPSHWTSGNAAMEKPLLRFTGFVATLFGLCLIGIGSAMFLPAEPFNKYAEYARSPLHFFSRILVRLDPVALNSHFFSRDHSMNAGALFIGIFFEAIGIALLVNPLRAAKFFSWNIAVQGIKASPEMRVSFLRIFACLIIFIGITTIMVGLGWGKH